MVQLTPNPSYSVALRVELPNRAGTLATVMQAIASQGGNLGHIDLVEHTRQTTIRDITVDASSTETC
jgi:malate dehydrogenase (oxaloacetate-decarboxylating)